MYQCEDCSREFEEPRYIKEYHYELDEQPYETFAVCPFCGGDISEQEDEDVFPLWKQVYYQKYN
jgi:hypothetical protein